MKKRFYRSDRVSEEILKEVSAILQKDMKDPRLGFVSVTRVETARDLRHANILVSVFGSEEEKSKSLVALKRGAGFIRGLLAKRMRLRFTPELDFKLDDSIERGARINKLLSDALPKEENEEEQEEPHEQEEADLS